METNFQCGYCGAKEFKILQRDDVNQGKEYIESSCCHRRYSIDQLFTKDGVTEDNINESPDQIANGEVKGIIE